VAWLLLLAALLGEPPGSSDTARRIAITIDDLPTVSVAGSDIDEAQRTTRPVG
jgi:hypothetical protein